MIMNTEIDWDSSIIDSRDIINRHEELTSEYEVAIDNLEIAKNELDEGLQQCLYEKLEDAEREMNDFFSYKYDELKLLESVINQAENYGDWSYGESLVNEKYFTQHIKDIIDDCYEFPTEMVENTWPYNHLVMDYEAAAEEAKVDYITIEVSGNTFFMRS